MTVHHPIGTCCARPRFTVDDDQDDRDRIAFAVIGVLAALAVLCAYALLR
jgi:hypothetical protein